MTSPRWSHGTTSLPDLHAAPRRLTMVGALCPFGNLALHQLLWNHTRGFLRPHESFFVAFVRFHLCPLNTSIPQGSALRYILFLLYIFIPT